jgi:competence protein ComEC
MLHPSRILTFALILFLLLVAYQTINESPESDFISIKNPFVIVTEPRLSGQSQTFLAQAVGQSINIQVRAAQFPFYDFGDHLTISGKIEGLEHNSYVQDQKGFFLTNNIRATTYYPEIKKISYQPGGFRGYWLEFRKKLITIRESLENNIYRSLPEPQAGLLAGILLGTRAELSLETKEILTKVGLIHIIALSGYNVTIIAEAMRLGLRQYSARLSFWGSFFGIWLFVATTGFSASVVRAALMGSLIIIAQKIGRRASALISVLVASTIMIFFNPYILLYDIGFQLSFAAVFGILFLAPLISKYFTVFGKMLGPILAATLSAQLFTFGIISFYFERISIVSLLANLLVAPIIPLVMLLGFLGGVASYLSIWFSSKLFYISWFLLTYVLEISNFLGRFRFAELSLGISISSLIVIYLFLFQFVFILKRRQVDVKNQAE